MDKHLLNENKKYMQPFISPPCLPKHHETRRPFSRNLTKKMNRSLGGHMGTWPPCVHTECRTDTTEKLTLTQTTYAVSNKSVQTKNDI